MILVDTNVLLDIVTPSPTWLSWSEAQLLAQQQHGLAINDVIYAELAYGFLRHDDLVGAVGPLGLVHLPMSRDALYRASEAFRAFRGQGGGRTSVLPDFFIGAHAEIDGMTLLTRDPKRYRQYFPSVRLITP